MNSNMAGKTVLITGATNGIGMETAKTLAEKNARVILVGRYPEKSARVVNEIIKQSGNQQIHFHLADLSHQTSIRKLAEETQQKYDRLDVLINNAGGLFWQKMETPDGIELTFALNHLNYFLLTNLLLDMLDNSPSSRIVNVSSVAHVGAAIHFDDLEFKEKYRAFKAYSQSKLANILFTYELARKLAGKNITVNALHPGFVRSNFGRANNRWIDLGVRISNLVAISPEKGSQTSVYLASAEAVEGISGKYFANLKCVRSSSLSYDIETANRLWDISSEMTGI